MSLGSTLAHTLEENRQRNLQAKAAKDAADKRKIEEERRSYELMITKTRNTLINQIEGGLTPHAKVTAYEHQQWIRKAQKGQATHQDLWVAFYDWATQEELTLIISEEHDGMGMQSWIGVSVEPLTPA